MIRRERLLVLLGTILFVGGLVPGFIGVLMGMSQSFNQVRSTGVVDEARVAHDVGWSMHVTYFLVPVVLLGMLLIVVGPHLSSFSKMGDRRTP